MATKSPTRRSRSTSSSKQFAVDASMRIIVLHGREPYLMTARTREIVQVLRDAHGEIEQFRFDGETAQVADVLDEVRSYGLIQQYKLVIVDKADDFLAAKGADDGRCRRILESYAKNPVDNATLLLRAETWRAGNLDKQIKKVGTIFKLEPPTPDKAVKWCTLRVQSEYEAAIEHAAAARLVEQIGTDLARLDVELSKLAAFVGTGNTISRQQVIDLVGMSREEKVWEIQSAIASGSSTAALEKLRELISVSNHPTELLVWAICDLLRKIHAGAHLMREGVNPHATANQLRLFGDSKPAILNVAQRCDPAKIAELFDAAIQMDLNNKTGVGESTRSLEVLTVRIADVFASSR